MEEQNLTLGKKIFKIITLIFAFTALAVSIVLSQSNSEPKKQKKKKPSTIYNSSKSGIPIFPKEENPSQKNSVEPQKEQAENNPELKKEQENKKSPKEPEAQSKEIKKYPVMPSSKAPDPGIYK
jgi:hypothetical protein